MEYVGCAMRTVFHVSLWGGLVRMAHPTKFKSEQAQHALSMRLAEAIGWKPAWIVRAGLCRFQF